MAQWIARDDGTRLWLDPTKLEGAKVFARLALNTPRSQSPVRNSARAIHLLVADSYQGFRPEVYQGEMAATTLQVLYTGQTGELVLTKARDKAERDAKAAVKRQETEEKRRLASLKRAEKQEQHRQLQPTDVPPVSISFSPARPVSFNSQRTTRSATTATSKPDAPSEPPNKKRKTRASPVAPSDNTVNSNPAGPSGLPPPEILVRPDI